MPRYFLHIHDDDFTPDEEGCEFADLELARVAAVEGARSLLSDQLRKGFLDLDGRIEITAETGQSLLTVRFCQVLEIRSSDKS